MIFMAKKIFIISLILFSILIASPLYAADANDTVADKTFTDLNEEIASSSSNAIELKDNFTFSNSTDSQFSEGVAITRDVTITGAHNTYIDGNNQTRSFIIESNCHVTLENLTFKNGFSNESGGAIFLKANSSIIIRNCIFENNWVYNSNGGAIDSQYGTITEIYDSLFFNNTSIRESDLEWEEFKRGMGSAICTHLNSTLKLENTHFEKNNAYLSTILVISYDAVSYELSTLTIRNCSFENNTSRRSGIIYLDEYGKGEIHDSIFRCNNITETSGTVILESSIYALVKNCLFEANTAIRGGAINLKLFNETGSNVTVVNCTFTGNFANVTGGAIYSNHGNLTVINSTFNDNEALLNGGGIYTNEGILNVYNCSFKSNNASYGGAISTSALSVAVADSSFIDNDATVKGGAIYSKTENVTSYNLTFENNTSPKGKDIYGAFKAYITILRNYFNDVELEIRLDCLWNLSPSQKVKLKLSGAKSYTTGWIETDLNGFTDLKIPSNLNVGTYDIELSVDEGFNYPNVQTLKLISAPCKLTVKKMTTSFRTGKLFKFYVINTKTNKKVAGAKLKFKVYTGKKYKTYTLTSDKNGLVKFNTGKLDAGKHTVKVTSANSNIKLSQVTTSITVKKASAKLSYAKKVKKGKKIKITVKNKNNNKVIKNSKFFIKVKGKSFYAKTNSKGLLKIATKGLKKGKCKITIIRKSTNYNINRKITVRIR